MKINNYFVFTVVCTLLGAGVGLAWRAYEQDRITEAFAEPQAIETLDSLPDTRYDDLDGTPRALNEFNGKVVVVNFWATWCPPCRKETPTFIKLQEDYGDQVQFVGIAVDEQEPVREFASSFGINYPVLLGDIASTSRLSQQLGNHQGGLPFTVLATPDGKVAIRHIGELKHDQLKTMIDKLSAAGSS